MKLSKFASFMSLELNCRLPLPIYVSTQQLGLSRMLAVTPASQFCQLILENWALNELRSTITLARRNDVLSKPFCN